MTLRFITCIIYKMSDTENNELKIINPYNFNNKSVNKHNVHNILSKFGISFDINDISLYQNSFVHKSYCIKKEDMQDDVELAERPEGALPLQEKSNER